ncbi:penicillin-binding protein activator LpoB [Campylobacter sp. Cr9]|uniref:penicillin-binding protein activator LpoB n=1 Tax=unclassified Campylobacter TaxID=2593542 RepID=UPI001EFB12FA|nr:penicillin-binding protein activator LpoB [Campylobacter sp. RM5004]MBZ7986273.1 penicillin-binding protein activator LpoB [Campylobacter sp. Cr9]ULO02279.1 outer membrane lipoprotein, putative peptidoglycan-synthase activator LpoB [Campylobacter sp. RM5004]
MKKTLMFSLALLLSACASAPSYVVDETKNGKNQPVSLGIDDIDLQNAARDMINSMLASPVFATSNPNERHVLVISRIINDTMQHFDTDILIKKIRIALLNSGKVYVTTAIGANGAEDKMSKDIRSLRDDDEFNQKTIAKKGTLISANRSLSGKIIQRNTRIKGTFSDSQRVDYYFQLTVTNLDNGLAIWEDEIKINKLGSNRSVAW